MNQRVSLARYYDWLSRYQRLAVRLGLGGGHDALTVHRLLSADRPGVSPADVVHERILSALGPTVTRRTVDAGCGTGGTVFFLQERLGGEYDGLTLSPVQRDLARREARRRGVSAACRFHLRSYDDDLGDLGGGVDLIVAIESLAHAPDPSRTIANLSGALITSGRLVVVDDVPGEGLPDDDPNFAGFREGWHCAAIARHQALLAAMRAADLLVERDEDLTPLVRLRDADSLERLVRASRRWPRVLRRTPARTLLDAMQGSLMLERLYRRGVMQYRLLVARRA